MPRSLLAVFAGGAVGTAARLGLDLLLPHPPAGFALSTLLVNALGCFVLALLTARLVGLDGVPGWLRAGLVPGLLGGFTSMSAVAVVLGQQLLSGAVLPAAAQVGAQVALSLLAVMLGLRLGRRREREG